MATKTSTALMLALSLGGLASAQAQTCPCGGGTLLTTGAAVQTLLQGRMVCATFGSERWQEWHNGGAAGELQDYKRGPTDPVDPSEVVGSYLINDTVAGGGAGVRYTYGTNSYAYRVCQSGATVSFCGAALGGRDITGAVVAASPGLQNCSLVVPAAGRLTQSRSTR